MKLKYKSFEFPVNPISIEISSSANCASKPVFNENSVTQNVSVNPVYITGSGELYGDNCNAYCACLQNIIKDKSSGWLILPSAPPVKAFFTKFKFSKSSKKNCVAYSFEFTEDCTRRKAKIPFKYTIAELGENAFEIANRCDVSVNDIMRLNDLKSPFEINSGDRVVLR